MTVKLRNPVATLAMLPLLVCTALGCSPGYVLRAGWEEARILADRRPIDEAVRDTTLSRETRAKLSLVRDGRDFAERTLGLDAGQSFQSFVDLSRDTLALNVQATYELEFRRLTWWFPIVGHVPYRGFFDFDQARAEADRLEAEGFEVTLGVVSAFSTLGWLPDPVMSTMLRLDSLSLAETVIHEIAHTTWYAPGHSDFNESFANFIGHRGAIAFYCDAVADPDRCQTANDRWHDTRIFGHFFHSVEEPLVELYASDLSDDEKRRRKREIFELAAKRFETDVKPQLRAGRYGSLDPDRLNNAWVLSRLLYYTRLDDFETVYGRNEDLPGTIRAIMDAANGRDPWTALDELTGVTAALPASERPRSDVTAAPVP